MLHTKFRGNRHAGQVPEKKIFEGFSPHMGVAAILVMLPSCREQTFVPPTQGFGSGELIIVIVLKVTMLFKWFTYMYTIPF